MREKWKPVQAVVIANGSTALEDGMVRYFVTAVEKELGKLPPQDQVDVIERLCMQFSPHHPAL